MSDEWVTGEDALELLFTSRSSFGSFNVQRALRNKPDDSMAKGRSCRSRLYHKGDIEELMRIRRVCSLSLPAAASVLYAKREGLL